MAYTNFPNGLTSFGVPLVGGFGGIPLTGKWWFCDYASGSDGNATSGSDGAPPDTPLKTIERAHELAEAGRNDVVVIMGDGSTTATQRLTETLVWSKNATHLLAITAPVMEAQRARISTLTTDTVNINPLMTISASGCIFANFSFFQGTGEAATAEQLLEITGDRNYFWNVQFGGMGAQAGADHADSYCILFTDGDENLFEHCSIGLETVQRAAANASVKVRSGSQRNMFRDCQFVMAADDTDPLFVDVNATGALNGSSLRFVRCGFYNLINISGAATLAVTATVAADANGTVFFDQCSTMAAKWAAASAMVKVAALPVGDGFDGGVFVSAADS